MAKMETIKFNDFMNGEWKKPKGIKKDVQVIGEVLTASGGTLILLLPKSVLAAGMDGAFGNIHGAIMKGFDAGVVLVIIFAGAAWGLGHRTKAIEILIGVCCGYILARHAVDIRDFLKGI
jgi:hypothetical protein